MFERFTEPARQVIVLAQDEARLLLHNYIGTEHLLLGLLREEEGVAAVALENLDVTLVKVRAQVARIVGQGDEVTSGQIPFTPRSKKVLELALREALSIGHNYVGSEHILLGIVRENEGVAARVLLTFDADAEKIRGEIMRLLTGPGPPRVHRWEGPGPPRVHARWEYDVLHVEEIEEKQLNELGAEGWELVAVAGAPGDFRLVVRRVG
jgi:ATP-dependent Clp protease ATP-binding subunit ClpC